jgi:SAM-dependent methyltransferase
MDGLPQIGIFETAWRWWREAALGEGYFRATGRLIRVLMVFARDSTPERLRQRFGDADYDWDHRVNTTSGAVGWRDRLLGEFHSAYQPTDPAGFHQMLAAVEKHIGPGFSEFTFLDLGSGKGRTLLMASDYAFGRIVGVELLPALDRIAQQNLRTYSKQSQRCFDLRSVCADATTFPLPDQPLVIYLFNPLPETGLRRVLANIEQTLRAHARPLYVIYYNPLLEHVLGENGRLRKIASAERFSIYSA